MALLPLTRRPPANRIGCQLYAAGCAWDVAQTALEVAAIQDDAIQSGASLMELTCASQGGWNGKPLLFRPESIDSITPPPWRSDTDDE